MENEAASWTRAQRAVSSLDCINPTPPPPQTPFKLIESISRSFQDIIFTLLNSLRASHWISLDFSWTFSVSSRFFPKAILFSFSVYRRPTDPNFWRFPTKKSSDVVKPFFTWNNSVNLKTEHSNSIEKNRNISYSALCILLIQICECWLLTSSCGTRASYSETTCDFFFSFFFFFFFFSIRPTDPISGNASDAKRKKRRGRNSSWSANSPVFRLLWTLPAQ